MKKARQQAFIYLGGSYPQLTAIRSLQKLGLYVAVADRDSSAPAAEIADRFEQSDVSDVKRVVALASDLQASHDVVGVYGVADYAFPSVLGVRDACGLAAPSCGPSTLLVDKLATSKCLGSNGLPAPQLGWSVSESSAEIQLPEWFSTTNAVIKARCGNNSKDVHILKDVTQGSLQAAISQSACSADDLMVEAYVEGRIGNVDGLMIAGHFHAVSTTLRQNDPDNPAVCTAMIQPAVLPGHEQRAYQLAEDAARALGYESGPFTVDLVIGADGDLTILEVSPHFHNIECEIARGNGNPMAAYGAWLMGRSDWQDHMPTGTVKHGMCYQKFVSGSGTITSVDGLDTVRKTPGVVDVWFARGPGDRVRCGSGYKDLLCLVWAVGDDSESLDRTIDLIEREICAVIEPELSDA